MDRATSSSFDDDDAKLPEYVLISYPGVVKNPENALEHFGGLQRISMNHFSGRSLEFHHHPNNLYSNPMLADRCPAEKASKSGDMIFFVASFRRRKSDPSIVKTKILGMVSTIYHIKSMADFQYLPLRRNDPSENRFEDMVPKLIPTDLASAYAWWNLPEVKPRISLHLPPYQFTRYTVPTTKMLSKDSEVVTEGAGQQKVCHGRSRRVERKAHSISAQGTDDFPIEPSQQAVNDADSRCKNEESHRIMKTLFDERPMWSRIGIIHKTGFDDTTIRSLLPKYAFYILSGPWGRLWCRFGYDPRIDPDAKKYQTVVVTFRQHAKIPEQQRLKASKNVSARIGRISVSANASLIPPTQSAQESIADADINYIYTPGELPSVRQIWYSICDIKLPIAEEILRNEFFTHGDRADDQYGWLRPSAITRIRQAIKEDVNKMCSQIDEGEVDNDEDWWNNKDRTCE